MIPDEIKIKLIKLEIEQAIEFMQDEEAYSAEVIYVDFVARRVIKRLKGGVS